MSANADPSELSSERRLIIDINWPIMDVSGSNPVTSPCIIMPTTFETIQ